MLVEFKRRSQRRVYQSDVVELSAQRYALQHSGQVVKRRAYVVVVLPDGVRTPALAVDLEDPMNVEHRVTDLIALIESHRSPLGARHAAVCASCEHQDICPRVLR